MMATEESRRLPRRERTVELGGRRPESADDALHGFPTGIPPIGAPVGDGRSGLAHLGGEVGLGQPAELEPCREPLAECDISSHVHSPSVNCESTNSQEQNASSDGELATSRPIEPYTGDVDRRKNRSDLITITDEWRKQVIAKTSEKGARAKLARAIGVSKSQVTKILRLKNSKATRVSQIGIDIALAIWRETGVPVPITVLPQSKEAHDILEDFLHNDPEAWALAVGNLRMLQAARKRPAANSVLTPPRNIPPNDVGTDAVPTGDGSGGESKTPRARSTRSRR